MMRRCPSCGREFEESYKFCPFDATGLGRRCSKCGREWDIGYQYCPLDSTPLAAEQREAPAPPAPAPEPRPVVATPPPQPRPVPPPVIAAPPVGLPPGGFTFEQTAGRSMRSMFLRPVAIIFLVGAGTVAGLVYYLTAQTGGPDLKPPQLSYSLLPNEGKTKGVPVAIKVNQLTVLMIDDPMESGAGAARAQQIVNTLGEVFGQLKIGAAVRFAVDEADGRPAILKVDPSGPDKRTLATVSPGDAALAGETDATRLAARWAERLTDAVNVYIFGEAPTFSTGTEFGQALAAMHKAALSSRGRISSKSLEKAFRELPEEKRRALETPPMAAR